MTQRVCEVCNLAVWDEDWYGSCEHCGRMIGPCCLSDLDDPPYCIPCELETREPNPSQEYESCESETQKPDPKQKG